MSRICSLLALLLAGGAAFGQGDVDRPKIYSGPALTAAERDQRESLYRYVFGLLCERDDKLIEALKAFEESAKLDPRASEPLRAQAPILLMLDRPRDAVNAVEASLKLDPDDHMSWFLAARLHKGFGEMKEFRACIEKCLVNPDLVSDDPALAQQLYLDLARYLESSDTPAEAVAPYRSAIKILDHPDLLQDHGPLIERQAIVAKAGDIYEKLGDLHTKLKQYAEAEAAYRKSMERRPDQGARLGFNLAKIDVEQNKPAEALVNLDRYLHLRPSSTQPYKMRLELLAKLNRKAEGLAWLDQASQADALNVNLKLLLAEEYAAAGSVAKAEGVYKALVADTPTEEAYRPYFKLLLERDRTGNQQMLEAFDAAVRTATPKPPADKAGEKPPPPQPQEVTARAAGQARAMLAVLRAEAPLGRAVIDAAYAPNYPLAGLDSHTRTFLAMLADQHGRLEQAERFYKVALLDRDPENEAALYAGLFRVLWRRHKFAAIATECRDALQSAHNTKPILFHTELAKALTRQGRLDEAAAAADRAFQVAADDQRMYVMQLKVRVLLLGARYPEAEKIARKMLEESTLPSDVQQARYMLSGVYSAWKKLDKCEVELLAILKSDPTNATANNDLGYIWADHSKNLPEAEAMIRKAIDLDREQRKTPDGLTNGDTSALDKDNAAYIDSLGWVLYRRGDVEGAVKQLERAVSLPEGDDPSLWDHLGDVYFRLERYRQAMTAWERSVELYETEHTRPQDEHYRDVKRKLKTAKELVRVP